MFNYFMYIVGSNDAGFEWSCPAYSAEQAEGYAKKTFGFHIKVRDVRQW